MVPTAYRLGAVAPRTSPDGDRYHAGSPGLSEVELIPGYDPAGVMSGRLGTAAAYLALAAGHSRDIGVLGRVSVLYPTITIVGVPAAAALAGWILAGRTPPSVARQALD